MGKAGYKRFKKQEKAKVKLKGNKTLLPKGQNVTDTNFKVKKIIVKEQLKQHEEQELLTKKHLNIKDLISRMGHHNVSMRQESISGMRELISSYGRDIVLTNFPTLLQAVMPLTIDKESDVRTDTLKLLSSIFEKITEKELSPLFPVVVCHLACAMTHIEPGIRADSMRLMDTMLATMPTLTAAHTPTLMPHFLDLISQRPGGGHGRTLSLHLDGRVTSEKWRGQVIGRLNRLFSVIWDNCQQEKDPLGCRVRWLHGNKVHLGLYSPLVMGAKKNEGIGNLPVKEYAEMLMPLLLDTFIEAVPKQEQEGSDAACVIGVDTAGLLQNIVEVILHIWNLLNDSSLTENLGDWFKKTWGSLVISRLLGGRFPYSITAANSRKRQRESEKMLAALQMSRDPSCSLLNLQLCLLAFLLTDPGPTWTQSIQYIKRSLRNERAMKPGDSAVLCQCLEAASGQPLTDTPSLLSIIAKSDILDNVDKPVNRRAFDFLTSVALRPAHHLHQDNHFTTWLDSLPALLTKSTIPLSVVRSIATVATHNLPAFCNSLDGWIEAILENLPRLKVTDDKEQEGARLVVGLIYWVTDWDQGMVDTVEQLLKQSSLDSVITSHLEGVLRLKIENTENEEIRKMLDKLFINS